MLILTFSDNAEKAIEKIITALANEMEFEFLWSVSSPMLSFSGFEIRQHQSRGLRNGKDIRPTHLEYGTLVFLASSPNRVFTHAVGDAPQSEKPMSSRISFHKVYGSGNPSAPSGAGSVVPVF